MLTGIGLFIGCVITGIESAVAEYDLDLFCDSTDSNPSNNPACEQLQTIYRLVTALTVSIQVLYILCQCQVVFILHLQAINAVCMVLILILFIWDIIYLSAGFNSKVPVPRGIEGQQDQ